MQFPSDPVELQDCQLNWEAIKKLFPSTVSALPTTSSTGEVYYVADDANSIIWHLINRGGTSWEFVGGTPLISATSLDDVGGTIQIPAITYTTILETVTAPLAGLYYLEAGLDATAVPGTTSSYMGIHLNGANQVYLQRAFQFGANAYLRSDTKITLAAGDIVTLRTRVDATVAGARYGGRHLSITPIRLS